MDDHLIPGRTLSRPLRHPENGRILIAAGVTLDAPLVSKIRRLGLESIALSCFGPIAEVAAAPPAPVTVSEQPEGDRHSIQGQIHELEARLSDDGEPIQGDVGDSSQPSTLRLAAGIIDVILDRLSNLPPEAMSDLRVYGRGALYSTLNVFLYSAQIGLALGLERTQLVPLCQAALLHNHGKRKLEHQFAFHSGTLTPAEARVIERDLEYGLSLIREQSPSFFSDYPDIYMGIRHQRERWDGTGYPQRRCGAQIPLISRIIAIAAMYDALRTTGTTRGMRIAHGDASVRSHNLEPFEKRRARQRC